jgi:cytidylate kinase
MVGRDIGTVVIPEAPLKIYLDASAEERARRRYEEQRKRGHKEDYDTILEDMYRRDRYDSNRAIAPLRPAPDAVIIKTDEMDVELVFENVRKLVMQTGS